VPEDIGSYVDILEKSKAAMDIEAGLRVAFPGCPVQVDLLDEENGEEAVYSVGWTDGPTPEQVGRATWEILRDGGIPAGNPARFLFGKRFSCGGVASQSGVLPVKPPGNVVPFTRKSPAR